MRSRRVRSAVLKRLGVGCQQRPARKSPSRRRLAGLRPVKRNQRRDSVRNGWRNSPRNFIGQPRNIPTGDPSGFYYDKKKRQAKRLRPKKILWLTGTTFRPG